MSPSLSQLPAVHRTGLLPCAIPSLQSGQDPAQPTGSTSRSGRAEFQNSPPGRRCFLRSWKPRWHCRPPWNGDSLIRFQV